MVNLINLRDGDLKQIFDAVEEGCNKLGIDFYVIGALARDIWYARENKTSRATRDVDFAIYVGNKEEFRELKNFLKEHKGFRDTKDNAFVILSNNGSQVDILPFGGIEIDDDVNVEGEGLTTISVNGFREVYDTGLEKVQIETGHLFNVASLASVVLLKIISFDDRPEQRAKDPGDIADIILNFFSLSADRIYEDHSDLFTNEEKKLETISSEVIGREIREICKPNPVLHERVAGILETHIKLAGKSAFVTKMCINDDLTIETAVALLRSVKKQL